MFQEIAATKKRYEEELRRLAFHDPLTGLPNRRLFTDTLILELEKVKESNEHLTIFYLDLDNLKQINDQLGHNIGDLLLIQFGERLQQFISERDMICRMGGDEFIILSPSLSAKEAGQLYAKKIIQSLETPLRVGELEITVTTSIGLTLYDDEKKSMGPEELIKQADDALYKAKTKGKNRYEFWQ
ncbi:diguanylate cyclase domain-containing protein [Bacillus sp. DJP31]|uniref:diguanylate cyclase domain-containing protein n=1 Tax=Bacillus sp. DJP31 TaxID=3409789 RepID=UPI003BB5794A